MIADGIVSMVIWFIQTVFLKLLPVNLPFLSYSKYDEAITTISSYTENFLVVADTIIDIDLVIYCALAVISLELLLFMFRALNWGINIVRGSGAKV